MIFIYGQEQFFIEKKLNEIVKKEGIKPINFDEESDLDTIIAEIVTISWFSEKKLLVLKNIVALSKEDEAKKIITALKTLDDSLEVVIINNSKMSRANSLVKFLLKNAVVHAIQSINPKEVILIIKDIVKDKGGTISNGAAISLSLKVPSDLRIIIAEIDKLLLESRDISKEQIKSSIGEYLIEDAFALSNAISSMDKNGMIYSYNKMLKNGEEPITIIAKIASVLLFALKVSQYKKSYKNNVEIADKMKVHIFRVKKANELIDLTSENKIKQIIIKLATLDKDIKTGKVNEVVGLNAFMLNLIK